MLLMANWVFSLVYDPNNDRLRCSLFKTKIGRALLGVWWGTLMQLDSYVKGVVVVLNHYDRIFRLPLDSNLLDLPLQGGCSSQQHPDRLKMRLEVPSQLLIKFTFIFVFLFCG